jgi:hypothetical protein
MVLELMFVIAAAEMQKTQKDRCAPNEIDASTRRTSPEWNASTATATASTS